MNDTQLESLLRIIFNVALLMFIMFPLFGIQGSLSVTTMIVIVLEAANKGFSVLWESFKEYTKS